MQIRTLALLCAAGSLAGCAATMQPQQAVTQLDHRTDKYETQECRSARQVALTYDDNVSGRVGVGLGLGLLLGPFGIPLAMAVDADQNKKRDAVLAELKRHCGEGAVAVPSATAQPGGAKPENVDAQATEHTECIPHGYKVGDSLTIRGVGDVTVKQIAAVNTQCGTNNSPPVQAVLVKVKQPALTPVSLPAPQPAAPRTDASAAPEAPVAAKLRQLNGMLRDGLITQQEYDSKKAELLRSF